jgi:L-aspartate oxidase
LTIMPNRVRPNSQVLKTDVLVLGSGLAGLLVSLKLLASGLKVILATKGVLAESNSSYAQGGIAASLPGNLFDSPNLHCEDTIAAGAGLTDSHTARQIIFSGCALIEELEQLGVRFDRDQSGTFSFAREGGHSRSRVLHNRDTTGQSLTCVLIKRLRQRMAALEVRSAGSSVGIFEKAFASRLIISDGRCRGAVLKINDIDYEIFAEHTVLATGGLGQVYARTTNPAIATGDGIALAHRAGAALIDMEFVQFHPTALAIAGAPAFLISEAVRGAGAILLDSSGKPFMKHYHRDAELATRDVVARAIHTVMMQDNQTHVQIDLRPIGRDALISRFPNILSVVREYGIDPLIQPIPVSPAAHYFMGGIMTDDYGNSGIARLSAIGECASVGLHGANRLASNSLLEAGVMALRCAENLAPQSGFQITLTSNSDSNYECDSVKTDAAPDFVKNASVQMQASKMPEALANLRSAMYANVSLVRTQASLTQMLDFLANNPIGDWLGQPPAQEAANMHLVSGLIAASALARTESRGAHFRDDFRETNDSLFKKRLVVKGREYFWHTTSQARIPLVDQSVDRVDKGAYASR